ncbi:META domain-containing protein [Larkinella soli]|uniref:META domain-containing protein n=1 Tax=Larkinella soli TaxID=1770527 RepID=UPI0013E300E7|nr:META domain-containing protein [Larkinella soli]
MKNIWIAVFLLVLTFSTESCRRSSPSRTPKKDDGPIETSGWDRKRKQGFDFTAQGADPGWVLDIDFTKTIRFQGQNGAVVSVPVPKPQRDARAGGIIFDTKAQGSRLRVTINPVACRETKTGEAFAYSVNVEANGRRYSGCGSFLNGVSRLNSTWVLESYRGQRLHSAQFVNRQMPFLILNTREKVLQGFTGCNTMEGKMRAEGDRIQLEPATLTRRGCPYNFESGFLSALQSASLYRISNNRLTLLSDGQYVMSFRKQGPKETGTAQRASP